MRDKVFQQLLTIIEKNSRINTKELAVILGVEEVDIVNELAPKFEEADGLVIASPVYYASANATLIALLDRLFYSTHFDKTMKVGASVVVARRGGCSSTYDELNKYFL